MIEINRDDENKQFLKKLSRVYKNKPSISNRTTPTPNQIEQYLQQINTEYVEPKRTKNKRG
jgi:hypothetical protein